MKSVPSFKRVDNGKYIYGREEVTGLTNALESDKSQIEINGQTIHILESHRNDEEWIVLVKVD